MILTNEESARNQLRSKHNVLLCRFDALRPNRMPSPKILQSRYIKSFIIGKEYIIRLNCFHKITRTSKAKHRGSLDLETNLFNLLQNIKT